MTRRPRTSIAANPALIGAVTTLVATIAVFLAYNANNGLPFVPTTRLTFQTPNGANLLPGNEVRLGGARAGVVTEMTPVKGANGITAAEVTMKIDRNVKIPVDSKIAIRPRSVLGLKYVDIQRGRARQTYTNGAAIPAASTRAAVELDDVFRMYDRRTRDGVQRNLQGFGDGLTARGSSLNETFGELPRLLRRLEPVARNLADPRTNLGGFIRQTARVAALVAPVSKQFASQFTTGADVFEAWGRFETELGQTIERTPATLATGVRTLPHVRHFLGSLRDFSGALERSADALPVTLPRINPALDAGIRVLDRSPQLNRPLRDVLRSLRDLMTDPATGIAVRGLGVTTSLLNPLVRYIGPFITVCNYWNYAWTYAGDVSTETDPTGTSARVLLALPPRPVNPTGPQLGVLGATRPVAGEPVLSGSAPALHLNLGSAAVDTRGNADCESGQRGYVKRNATYAPADRNIAIDPRIPGNQGPTYTGLSRVPPGQTFTRNPLLGPPLPPELDK
jgi:virulence factor Mce-like protein